MKADADGCGDDDGGDGDGDGDGDDDGEGSWGEGLSSSYTDHKRQMICETNIPKTKQIHLRIIMLEL